MLLPTAHKTNSALLILEWRHDRAGNGIGLRASAAGWRMVCARGAAVREVGAKAGTCGCERGAERDRAAPGDSAPLDEWVYNQSDIDHAKVIWARDMGSAGNLELIRYYRDRSVWLVEPDQIDAGANPARVRPYPFEESR
jgi:hypothetical protein